VTTPVLVHRVRYVGCLLALTAATIGIPLNMVTWQPLNLAVLTVSVVVSWWFLKTRRARW
jgi:hypothetical protein